MDLLTQIKSLPEFKLFISDCENLNLNSLKADVLLLIKYNLNELEDYAKVYSERNETGHYVQCVSALDGCEEVVDTCICDILSIRKSDICNLLKFQYPQDDCDMADGPTN